MVLASDRQIDASSRIEPRLAPRSVWRIAFERDGIVEAEWPLLPELNGDRHNPVARPVWWPGNLADGVFRRINGNRLFEGESAFQRRRLLAGPGPNLRL